MSYSKLLPVKHQVCAESTFTLFCPYFPSAEKVSSLPLWGSRESTKDDGEERVVESFGSVKDSRGHILREERCGLRLSVTEG